MIYTQYINNTKGKNMKMKTCLTLAAVLGALSLTTHAQDAGGPPPGGPDDSAGQSEPGSRGGPGMGRHHPIPAIVTALDTNHDGIIDSNEIANASAALMTLDKKGDGKLTRDEYMGKPPGHRPMNENGGPDGQGQAGQGGQDQGGPPQGAPPQDAPGGPNAQSGQGGPDGSGAPRMNGHRPIPAISNSIKEATAD